MKYSSDIQVTRKHVKRVYPDARIERNGDDSFSVLVGHHFRIETLAFGDTVSEAWNAAFEAIYID